MSMDAQHALLPACCSPTPHLAAAADGMRGFTAKVADFGLSRITCATSTQTKTCGTISSMVSLNAKPSSPLACCLL